MLRNRTTDLLLIGLQTLHKYTLPLINEVLDSIGRAKYFSSLDLKSGYLQIEMTPDDVQKTAYTAVVGHYEVLRMPLGLTYAPATFQRVVNRVLGETVGRNYMVYSDNNIIYSPSLQQHINDLRMVSN